MVFVGVFGAVLALVLVGAGILVLRGRTSAHEVDLRPQTFSVWLSWARLTPQAIRLRGLSLVLFGAIIAALTVTMLLAPDLLGAAFIAAAVCWLALMAAFFWEYLGRRD